MSLSLYNWLKDYIYIYIYTYLQTYIWGFYKKKIHCSASPSFLLKNCILFLVVCFLLISYFLYYLYFYFSISNDPIHSFNWQPAPQRYPFRHFNQLCHIASELFKNLKYSFASLALRQCVGLAVLAFPLATMAAAVAAAFILHYLLCQSIWHDTFGDLLLAIRIISS